MVRLWPGRGGSGGWLGHGGRRGEDLVCLNVFLVWRASRRAKWMKWQVEKEGKTVGCEARLIQDNDPSFIRKDHPSRYM